MRLAGWQDDEPVWTGSCPCQPFSAAGTGQADEDDRHLAPAWLRLIAEYRPPVLFGEQVDAAVRVGWLDAVFTELESHHYACGAFSFNAASVGAPHIRQRIYFVGDSSSERHGGRSPDGSRQSTEMLGARCEADPITVAVTAGEQELPTTARRLHAELGECCVLGDSASSGRGARPLTKGSPTEVARRHQAERCGEGQETRGGRATGGFWADAEWLPCVDGKARPVEPGTFPLAHGAPARVGRLRAYGNAIVAPQAVEFIRAYRMTRESDISVPGAE